jgi:hypothetical protein
MDISRNLKDMGQGMAFNQPTDELGIARAAAAHESQTMDHIAAPFEVNFRGANPLGVENVSGGFCIQIHRKVPVKDHRASPIEL